MESNGSPGRLQHQLPLTTEWGGFRSRSASNRRHPSNDSDSSTVKANSVQQRQFLVRNRSLLQARQCGAAEPGLLSRSRNPALEPNRHQYRTLFGRRYSRRPTIETRSRW
jgi:hypothetical protein